jgi:hypothetical protein
VRKPPSVALERTHVVGALFAATVTAVVWLIVEAVPDGFTWHEAVIAVGYFVFLAVALTWANWHEDKDLDGQLRASRRRTRRARPRRKAR